MTFEAIQKVADAVLYEGYLLYPYHATSGKNRVRFQFGVVAPRDFSVRSGSESWEMQTECLVDARPDARLDVRIRFLQLQARTVEAVGADSLAGFVPAEALDVDGEAIVPWDEAVERQVDVTSIGLTGLLTGEQVVRFAISGGEEAEIIRAGCADVAGRVIRTRWPIDGLLRLSAEPVDGLVRIRVRIENHTESPAETTDRPVALRWSFLGCHTLLAVQSGAFVSLMDPPPAAAAAVAGCTNIGTWPVLAGDDDRADLVLSSPIILYDHPKVAPESQADLFDATEIDEILTLRIMTLSDEEKRSARATDPRARAIIDAAESLPAEMMDRLHGSIRYLRDSTRGADAAAVDGPSPAISGEPDWPTFRELPGDRGELPASVWEPEARVVPDRAAIEIGGMTISKGASVRLRPNRRADSMDTFLVGRVATVEAVYESVDDHTHVAVTVDDDPATDLHRAYGRYFYFAPDELEPLAPAPAGDGPAPIVLEPSSRSLEPR